MMVNIMQFLSIQRRFVMYRLVCFVLFWYIVVVFFFGGVGGGAEDLVCVAVRFC